MSSRSRRLSSLGAVRVLGCPSSECRDRAAWRYAHDQFRQGSFVTRSLSTKLLLLQHLPHPISVCSALGSDVACIPYPYALLSAQMLHASHILVLCSRLRCGSGGRQGYASRSPLDRIRICSSSRRARRRVRCQSGTSASVSSAPGRSGWSACRAAAGEKR